MVCQQEKDSLRKNLTDLTSLEVPLTNNGFDCIITYVDRLSRRVHFTPSQESDTVVDITIRLFSNVLKHHGMPGNIMSDRDPKFT